MKANQVHKHILQWIGERSSIPPFSSNLGSASAGAFFGGVASHYVTKHLKRQRQRKRVVKHRSFRVSVSGTKRQHQQAVRYWERVIAHNPHAAPGQRKQWQYMLKKHQRALQQV